MKGKWFVLGCWTALLVLLTGAWTNGAAAPAQEVVIGYTAPLSGPAAEYGQDCVNGVEMAINEINKAGGITVKGKKYVFRLEKLDDRIDPTQAVNNARRFRDQFKAPAIFNPVFNTSPL
jgi:branched-chain amino acid transport system substrate-binding protein